MICKGKKLKNNCQVKNVDLQNNMESIFPLWWGYEGLLFFEFSALRMHNFCLAGEIKNVGLKKILWDTMILE